MYLELNPPGHHKIFPAGAVLDLALHPGDQIWQMDHDELTIAQLVEHLQAQSPTRVVDRSTDSKPPWWRPWPLEERRKQQVWRHGRIHDMLKAGRHWMKRYDAFAGDMALLIESL